MVSPGCPVGNPHTVLGGVSAGEISPAGPGDAKACKQQWTASDGRVIRTEMSRLGMEKCQCRRLIMELRPRGTSKWEGPARTDKHCEGDWLVVNY